MRGGSLVKEARLRAGLTQAALAERLGTSQPVIARWETGAAEPGFRTVVEAIRACGLDLHVSLVPHDEHDLILIAERLALSPRERVDRNGAMLALERLLHEASPTDADG
jgi:transcriptional regulator with XRE-family HTH domain